MSKVEFIEEGHIYLVDGVICPISATNIVSWKYPDIYANIPRRVLNDKAKYGTLVHKYVEELYTNKITLDEVLKRNIDPFIKRSCKDAIELRKKYPYLFNVKTCEEHMTYESKFCGSLDLRLSNDKVVDIKTTATLHVDNNTLDAPLNLQISLYNLCSDNYLDYGYYIHLPKAGKSSVGMVNTLPKEKTIKIVEEYLCSQE